MEPPGTDSSEQLTSLPDYRRLLIVRLGSMGDIVHALPAAIALRRAFPMATLGWIVEERWVELLCTPSEPRSGPRSVRRPIVDRIHTVNTKAWRTSLLSTQTWERIAAGLSELRAPRYEAAVDFQGAVRSALFARCSGAPEIYGASQPWENVASMFYSRQVFVRGEHVVEQNLSLAEAVTRRKLDTPAIEFPCDEAAEKRCDDWLRREAITDFVLLNPGAGWGAKQWPPDRYAIVAKRLGEAGMKALINFGPGEETLARTVAAASNGVAQLLRCTITELIAFTRRARLFVGGDTGPMHLAAALGVPVVAIFGPTNPRRNGPFGSRSIVLRSASSRTTHQRHTLPGPGLLEITPDQVIAAAQQLLGGCHG